MNYLGLPLGANPRKIQTWAPVIEKVEKALKPWKSRHISMDGKLTLVSSNMSNLPIYYMSLFRMPTVVANKIEKIQRKFLWGDTEERKKLHLIGWDKLTRKKKYGSLGIKRLMEQNTALLAKWWWRFNKEKEALWVKVVSSKYDLCEGAWLPHLPNRRKASNLWKVICSVSNMCADMGEYVIQGFMFKVNFGTFISFWKHKWLGKELLQNIFPGLFMLSIQKDAMIANMVDSENQGHWKFQFTRRLHDWEEDQLNILG